VCVAGATLRLKRTRSTMYVGSGLADVLPWESRNRYRQLTSNQTHEQSCLSREQSYNRSMMRDLHRLTTFRHTTQHRLAEYSITAYL
jgi:hypothetical protein